MTHDPLVEATKLLSSAVKSTGDVDDVPDARDEAIAKLGEALRARARARRNKRIAASCAIAASVLALIGGGAALARLPWHAHAGAVDPDLGHLAAGPLTVVRDGRQAALDSSRVVAEGSELRTPMNAEARLEYASGTNVTLGGGTLLSLVEQSKRKRFVLKEGSFTAKVSKLGPDERFVVATVDSEVEVRGTKFRVSIVVPDANCGEGTPTRLEVAEGVVVVRHAGIEANVTAGGRWPDCATGKTAAEPNREPEDTARATRAPATPPQANAATPSHRHAPAAASTSANETSAPLAAQNALYGRAVREKNEGRADLALATVDELIATYPQGPLAESAYLLRMRILASTDRVRGAAAAQDYLRRYPSGFGRDEATALAGAR